VGLGNPGEKYIETRHNAGFMVVQAVADHYAIRFKGRAKFSDLQFGVGQIEGARVVLAKPLSFMNRSGPPVRAIANFFQIQSKDMLVVHDDIDLALGRIKIKEKGGHGGHKGVKSLFEVFEGDRFVRMRIGIGRPEKTGVTGHVLGRFDQNEKKVLEQVVHRARDAVVMILCRGITVGMNQFNQKEIETEP